MLSFVLVIITSIFLLLGQSPVKAQETPPVLPFDTPSPTPNQATPVSPLPSSVASPTSTPVVVGGSTTTSNFVNLQKQYLLLLEQYRAQEQTYTVAKAQYQQLNTLASQELAVQETRKLIDIRADVFLVYLDMLIDLLDQTKGIPLENKSPQLVKLRLLKETVQLHKSNNNVALDRFAVDQESQNFTNTIETLQSEAYYTLGLIRVGRVQQAVDKLLVVRDAVENDVMSRQLTSAQKAQKERGFNEIQLVIDNTNTEFTPIKKKVFTDTDIRSLGDFSGLTSELNPVFAGINQTIEYLQEIRK